MTTVPTIALFLALLPSQNTRELDPNRVLVDATSSTATRSLLSALRELGIDAIDPDHSDLTFDWTSDEPMFAQEARQLGAATVLFANLSQIDEQCVLTLFIATAVGPGSDYPRPVTLVEDECASLDAMVRRAVRNAGFKPQPTK